MDFSLSATHLELGKVAADFFADKSPLTAVRRVEDEGTGFDSALWRAMARLEWTRLGHDESVGGVGGGVLDLVMIYQEMGRTLCPSPHLESAVISAGVLAAAAGHEALLAGVLDGSSVVVPALMEPSGTYGPEGIALSVSGGQLTGTKVLVPYVDSSVRVLVAGRESDGEISLTLVDPRGPGVTVEAMPNIAGTPLSVLRFQDAAGDPVAGGWGAIAPVLDRATVLRSAQIVGAAERLLDLSVGYAQTRSQFGKPIGAYQAVQYLCTDIAIASHLASLATLRAAALLDLGAPAARAVAEAKARASAAARIAAEKAHEVHAGFAFMMEADIQLFTRRLRHWELDLGDEDHHRARFADALLAA
jgi:acyl-CoA dehydrogenase